MKPFEQQEPKRSTARCRIAAVLTQEILSRSDPHDFPIASEHQLCERFGVSRVTIRLAFADLEHRRLIYRRHGLGTFAHARCTRAHSNLGIFVRSPDVLNCDGLVEFMRGALTVMTSFNSSVVLLTASPHIWRTEMTGGLGGVAVFLTEFDRDEEQNLKDRRIPFMYISKASLSNGAEDYFHLGIRAAEALDCAVFGGELVVGEQR